MRRSFAVDGQCPTRDRDAGTGHGHGHAYGHDADADADTRGRYGGAATLGRVTKRERRQPAFRASLEPAGRPPCPLCARPNFHPSDHHLIPKSRGGKDTETLCRDCHSAIHATFTNKELERELHTKEALLAHPDLRPMIDFIARQDPGGRVRTVRRQRLRKR